ncbi:hypothetical protein CUMW_265500, partial [Citrus unshiu]
IEILQAEAKPTPPDLLLSQHPIFLSKEPKYK